MARHLLFIIGVLLIVGGGWWLAHGNDPRTAAPGPQASSTVKVSTTTPKAAPKKDTGLGHAGLSYGEAVNIFANRKIQFDPNCVAVPNYVVVKNGTNMMFDNRSNESRTIVLDGHSYRLAAYDFRILTLSSSKLPHTTKVDCGSGRNNAQIVIN